MSDTPTTNSQAFVDPQEAIKSADVIKNFSGSAADIPQLEAAIKQLKEYATGLQKAGLPVVFITEKLKQMTGSAETASFAVKGLQKSLTDLAKMSPQEFLKDFRKNMGTFFKETFGTMLGEVGAIAEAAKLAGRFLNAIDQTAVALNQSMYRLALQTGNIKSPSGGIGGVFGRPSGFNENIYKQIQDTGHEFITLNYTMEDFKKTMAMASVLLPSSQEGKIPLLTSIAGQLAVKFQMDLGQSIELVSELFRRGHTSGQSLVAAFEALAKTAKVSGLSFQQGTDITTNLWNSTRLLGVTFGMANSTVRSWDEALERGATTQEEITQMQARQMEAPISKVMGMISLADKMHLAIPGEQPGDSALSLASRAGLFELRMFGKVQGGQVTQAGLKGFEKQLLGQAGTLMPMGGDLGGRAASAILTLQNLISQFPFLPVQTLGGAQRLLSGAIPGMPAFEGGGLSKDTAAAEKELADQTENLKKEAHGTAAVLAGFTERVRQFKDTLLLNLAGGNTTRNLLDVGSLFGGPGGIVGATVAEGFKSPSVVAGAIQTMSALSTAIPSAAGAVINAPITISVDLSKDISDVSRKVEAYLRSILKQAGS